MRLKSVLLRIHVVVNARTCHPCLCDWRSLLFDPQFTERGSVRLSAQIASNTAAAISTPILQPRQLDPGQAPLRTVDLRFVVEDTGPGMTEIELAAIFRPFSQSKLS